MAKSNSLIFWSVICLSQISMVACASTEQKDSKPAPVYFSDCGVVNLQTTDGGNMTREELIAAEENALLDALDENQQCNEKALAGGQQAVASAGNGAGGSQGSGTANGNGQPNGNVQQSSQNNANSQQNQQVITANSGVGGAKTGVNGQEITVCQISRENLAAASTPEDKTFWQGEVDKNCN